MLAQQRRRPATANRDRSPVKHRAPARLLPRRAPPPPPRERARGPSTVRRTDALIAAAPGAPAMRAFALPVVRDTTRHRSHRRCRVPPSTRSAGDRPPSPRHPRVRSSLRRCRLVPAWPGGLAAPWRAGRLARPAESRQQPAIASEGLRPSTTLREPAAAPHRAIPRRPP